MGVLRLWGAELKPYGPKTYKGRTKVRSPRGRQNQVCLEYEQPSVLSEEDLSEMQNQEKWLSRGPKEQSNAP